MRTDSFSLEKHLPVRRFIADESKVATGLYGPRAIADDIDNIHAMFDPQAELLGGTEKGGISEKNLQDGAVSAEKLNPDLKEKLSSAVSKQQLNDLLTEYDEKLENKAEIADTLNGYGITDAYTKEETNTSFLSKGDFILEKSGLVTADMLDNVVSELDASVSKKMEETILYEDVVNTPKWTNQPTFEGVLEGNFDQKDFYYVTLKDASGKALPAGQFMLKDFYTDGATVYPIVFSLPDLNTGTNILVENYPVEFTSMDVNFGMRDAGVWEAAYSPSAWKLGGNCGQLRFVCDGEFIQRVAGAYYITCATTDKKVSHYHSLDSTAFQSDSTSQIVPYIALGGVASYKLNQFRDEMILERLSDKRYLTERKTTLRCLSYGGTTYKNLSNIVFGHGEISNKDTLLTKMNIQVASNTEKGCIRNGSVIRVTEVK